MTIGRALRYIVEERVSDPVTFCTGDDRGIEGPAAEGVCRAGNRPRSRPSRSSRIRPPNWRSKAAPSLPARSRSCASRPPSPGERLAPDHYDKIGSYLERLTVSLVQLRSGKRVHAQGTRSWACFLSRSRPIPTGRLHDHQEYDDDDIDAHDDTQQSVRCFAMAW